MIPEIINGGVNYQIVERIILGNPTTDSRSQVVGAGFLSANLREFMVNLSGIQHLPILHFRDCTRVE